MADDLEKIKLRIKALLAKANDTAATVAEAQAFNAKAYELMEKYNLERSTVEQADQTKRTHLTLKVLVRPWSTRVLAGIAHLYFCKWFYKQDGRSHTVTIIGEESNAAICHAIAVMVLRAVQQEAKATGGGRSFMNGAGESIHQRCYEMRPVNQLVRHTNPQIGASQNALVVLGNKEAEGNADYMATVLGVGKLRMVKSSPKARESGAVAAGRQYGNSLPLNNRLL